jgi:hypothetical protein
MLTFSIFNVLKAAHEIALTHSQRINSVDIDLFVWNASCPITVHLSDHFMIIFSIESNL